MRPLCAALSIGHVFLSQAGGISTRMEVQCAIQGMRHIRNVLKVSPAEFVSDACTTIKAAASKLMPNPRQKGFCYFIHGIFFTAKNVQSPSKPVHYSLKTSDYFSCTTQHKVRIFSSETASCISFF